MGDSELESSGSGQKQMAGPYEHGNTMDMVEKSTNLYKRLRVPCTRIINTACLLHVSATLGHPQEDALQRIYYSSLIYILNYILKYVCKVF